MTKLDSDIYIVRDVVGGTALELGAFYDIVKDAHLIGTKLFSTKDVKVQHSLYAYNETTVTSIRNERGRYDSLDIGSSLSASVMSGLVKVDGSCKYVNDGSLRATDTITTVRLKTRRIQSMVDIDDPVLVPLLKEERTSVTKRATHVVIGIHRGCDATVMVRGTVTDEGRRAMVIASGTTSVDGVITRGRIDAASRQQVAESVWTSRLDAQVYIDAPTPPKTPLTVEDIANTVASIDKIISELKSDDMRAMRVWLMAYDDLQSHVLRRGVVNSGLWKEDVGTYDPEFSVNMDWLTQQTQEVSRYVEGTESIRNALTTQDYALVRNVVAYLDVERNEYVERYAAAVAAYRASKLDSLVKTRDAKLVTAIIRAVNISSSDSEAPFRRPVFDRPRIQLRLDGFRTDAQLTLNRIEYARDLVDAGYIIVSPSDTSFFTTSDTRDRTVGLLKADFSRKEVSLMVSVDEERRVAARAVIGTDEGDTAEAQARGLSEQSTGPLLVEFTSISLRRARVLDSTAQNPVIRQNVTRYVTDISSPILSTPGLATEIRGAPVIPYWERVGRSGVWTRPI